MLFMLSLYRIRILRIFRKFRKLRNSKDSNSINLLTYILIVINKATIRITDSFSFDYANLLYCIIFLSPYSHGLSTDVLLWFMISSNRTSFRSTRFCVSKRYNVGRALMLYRSCWSISGAYTLSHAGG